MRRSVITALLGLALAGCTFTLTLNTDNLKNEIKTGIEAQNPGVTVSDVTCPDSEPLKQGDVFTCTAATSEGTVTVTVTQNDDKGNITWEITGTAP